MAVTQNSYTQSGSTTEYAFTFPYLKTTDIKVQLDAAVTTAFSLLNATTIKLDSAPAAGTAIKIYRETDTDSAPATFYAGSSVKSEDLNDNFTQNLYANQEINARYISNLAPVLTGDVNLQKDVRIIFEGSTDSDGDHKTTLTVTDPTDARTITLPNVTGTVVTTGDTGTVTSTMITDATIVNGDIANTTITGGKLVNDTITSTQIAANAVTTSELADSNVTTAKIADNAVTTAKIPDSNITQGKLASPCVIANHINSGAVTTAKINDQAVTEAKLAASAVTVNKIGDGAVHGTKLATSAVSEAKIASNAVTTAKIVNANVTTDKLADSSVTTAKIGNNQVTTDKIPDGHITLNKLATNSVDAGKITDGSVTTAKLATNAVTTAKITDGNVTSGKLATGSVTEAKIAANAVTNAKIAGSAVTSASLGDNAVTTAKIVDDAVTNAKIATSAVSSGSLGDNSVTTPKIVDDAVTTAKIAANAVTTTEIADSELSTLATMQAGTASILAGGTALTSTLSELNLLDGKTFSTAVSGSSTDTQIPSAKAVNDQIVSLMQDAGGYYPIADDASFPNTNPDPNDDAGTIVSIADAGGLVVNGSGVSTTGRTLGGSTVTINGIDSSLNSTTIAAGKGMLVQTTSTLNTYTYHRLLLDEAGVASAQTLVTDFNARYRIGASNPTSSLDDGDLFFNTTSNKMLVYNVSGSSWDEVTSAGDFKILTVVPNGATTGSPVFDGSIDQYDLRDGSNAASVTKAQQLIVSLNGVIQKPNAAYDASGEGFALDGSDGIRFCDPPAAGSTLFVTQIGSAVALNAPSTNSVTTGSIQNAAVTTDKLGADAVTGAKIANDAVGSEHIEVLDANLQFGDSVKALFGAGDDLEIYHSGSNSFIDEVGTGNLLIRAAEEVQIKDSDSSEAMGIFKKNGAVELYYDNVKKFETTSGGAQVTGNLRVDGQCDLYDDKYIRFGDSADLQIWHNSGGNSYIKESGGGSLVIQGDQVYIQGVNTETKALFTTDGSVELYHDGTKKLETLSNGVEVTGNLRVQTSSNSYGTNLYDNIKSGWGSGQDLQIYHDGTDSFITNATGILNIKNDDIRLKTSGDETMLRAIANGAVELMYDNSKKAYTYSNGLALTANLSFVDSGKAVFGSGNDLEIYHDGSHSFIKDGGTGNLKILATNLSLKNADDDHDYISCIDDGAVELYYDNAKKAETVTGGFTITGTCTATSFAGDGSNLTGVSGADLTPAFAVRSASENTTLSSGSFTAIGFDTEDLDTDSAYDLTNHEFTVPSGEGGKYQLDYHAAVDSVDSNDQVLGAIYKDTGSGYALTSSTHIYNKSPTNGTELSVAWSGVLALDAGDKIQFRVSHNQGGNQGVKAMGGQYIAAFSGFKIA